MTGKRAMSRGISKNGERCIPTAKIYFCTMVRISRYDSIDIRSGQVKLGQIRPSQAKSSSVSSGQVRSSRVSSGQVRSSRFKSGQIRSEQIKLGRESIQPNIIEQVKE